MKKRSSVRFGAFVAAVLSALTVCSAASPVISFDVESAVDFETVQNRNVQLADTFLELPESALELPLSNDEQKELLAKTENDASLFASAFEGSGTEKSPYLIQSKGDLRLFATSIRSGSSTYIGAHYKLTADIDLEGEHWTPVGTYSSSEDPYATAFAGVFDGDGHTVKNFRIAADARHLGFFGLTYNASIRDLTISDFSLELDSSAARPFYVGGLVGRFLAVGQTGTAVDCSIENCHIKDASIDITGAKYSVYAGGLAGSLHASDGASITVTNSDSTADVAASLVGFAAEAISTTTFNVYAGGLVGYVGATKEGAQTGGTILLQNAYSTGHVQAVSTLDNGRASKDNLKAGGFIGYLGSALGSSVTVEACYSLGTVASNAIAENYSASFLGYMIANNASSAIVRNCYTASGVYAQSSKNEAYLSGFTSIAGEQKESTFRIEHCYTAALVIDTAVSKNTYGGSMAAYALGNTSFVDCYAHESALVACKNLIDDSAAPVTVLSDEKAADLASYAGFSADVWENSSTSYVYPTLKNTKHIDIPLTVTFMTATGVFETQKNKQYGDIVTFPETTPSSKYTFSHWSLAPGGEAVENFALRCDTRFYPIFSDTYRSFTITFVADGEAFQTSDLVYGTAVAFPAPPEKAADQIYRYVFSHWSTTENGADDCKDALVSGKATYYAVYEKVAIGSWDGVTALAFEEGDGTAENPYQIKNAYNLFYLSQNVSSEAYSNAHYVLARDIDLGNFSWTPIGTEETPFSGVFDGAGYSITGLKLTTALADVGLFGYTEGATIRKLALYDFTIQLTDNTLPEMYVGVLVGRFYVHGKNASAEITECSITGDVSVETPIAYVGGFSGKAYAGQGAFVYIEDSFFDGTIEVTAADSAFVGGITGYYRGTSLGVAGIDRCYASVDITSNVTKTNSTGTSIGAAYVGGIVGYLADDEAYIEADEAGLLLASETGTARNCFTRGAITVTASRYTNFAGHIYGQLNQSASISNCAADKNMTINTIGKIAENANITLLEDAAKLYTEDFLKTLGFDTQAVWRVRENALPLLQFENMTKNVYRVKSFEYNKNTGALTASFLISYRDVAGYSILAASYDVRGKMIGFTICKIDDPSNLQTVLVSLPSVKGAASCRVAVIDSTSFALLEEPMILTNAD